MPRRNVYLIVGLTVLGLMSAVKVSWRGRILVYAMDEIQARYVEPVERDRLFEGALAGMLNRLDDYSEYISPKQTTLFEEHLERRFGGVGIEILLDPQTKQLTVASPLVGTPAYEAGILAGDKILQIDGQSTEGLSIEDAAARMRGQPGDPVTLTILHEGQEEPVEVRVVRAVIQVETVLGDTRNADGSWNYFLAGHGKIGYLRVNSSFAERTDSEVARAVRWLVEHGMQGLILDLRNNPGGMLGAAIGVCDLFVDSGVIVTTRRRGAQTQYRASQAGTYSGFPIAVLVNDYSASASEIVAACLQDHGRAVVVGERTYGKGTVQEIIPLGRNEGMLKLTTASYWRPSGKNIDRHHASGDEDDWGVIPNEGYRVELSAEQRAKLLLARLHRDLHQAAKQEGSSGGEDLADSDADPQLAKAVEYIEKKIKEGNRSS